jgi:LysM repeat protein
MGMFGQSFDEKVQAAVTEIAAMGLGLQGLRAEVEGKVVTLRGLAPDLDAKKRAMREFNAKVETENTLNLIELVPHAPTPPPAAPVPAPTPTRVHEVVPGDTLGAIAQHYYGKASLYMKIFEANRDQLSNPNLIKVGQKLKIPD